MDFILVLWIFDILSFHHEHITLASLSSFIYNIDLSDPNYIYFRILIFFSIQIRVTSRDVYAEMGVT